MEENENTPALWCDICRVSCCSDINLQSHFMGRMHRMVEESLRKKDEAPAGEESAAGPEELAGAMEENENTPALWCHLCRVSCCSDINLQSHFMGRRHRLVEEALRKKEGAPAGEESAGPEEKEAGNSDDGEEAAAEPNNGDSMPWQSLAEVIEDTRGKEAALGLEYIYEFKRKGAVVYDCRLCELCVGRSHMFTHIIGQKHRTNYLSVHHPDITVVNGYVSGSHGKKKRKLRDVCLEIESKYGRKEINVVTGEYRGVAYAQAKKAAEIAAAAKDIDFTSDDPILPKEEKPPAPIMQEDHVHTFVELRDRHMAGLRVRGADVVAEPAAESGEEDGDGGKDAGDKMEGAPFLNNKELVDFLDQFPVRTAEHVKFILNVTKKLTGAMERHKVHQEERKKEEEERKKKEEEERIRREEEERKRREEEELEKKRKEEEEKRKREEEERKREEEEREKALYKPGAKLAFRIAAPPVEPNPLVSSDSLSNMQREFVSKGRPSKRSLEEETEVADGETQQYQPELAASNPYAEDDVDFSTPQQSDAISQLSEAPRPEPAKRRRSAESPEDAFQPKPVRADYPPPHRTDSRGQDSQAPYSASKPARQSRWGPEVAANVAPPRAQRPRGILKNADHSGAQERSRNHAYAPPSDYTAQRNNAYAPPSDYTAQRNNAYAPPTDQNRYEASRNNAYAPPSDYTAQRNSAYAPPTDQNRYEDSRNNVPPRGYEGPQNNAYAPSREQDRYGGARNVASGHPRDQDRFEGPKNNTYAPQGNQNRFEGQRNNAYGPPGNQDRFGVSRNAPQSNQDGFEGPRNAFAPRGNQDRFEGQRNDAFAPPRDFDAQRNDAYAPPGNQDRFGGSRNAYASQSNQEGPRNNAFAPPREQERYEGSKYAYAPPREAEHYNDDYAPPGDRDPYASAPSRAQNPQGLRNAPAPSRAQNPQGLRNAPAPSRAQNLQGLRNAPAPSRAQNPQGLRNAPYPHELVLSRAPASQGPMGNRTGFAPLRATNASDFGRNPTVSAPRGAHQPRDWSAPMPAAPRGPMSAAPRGPMNAAPQVPGFPGAKDAITAKFFESIKSMDPSEVVSTLEKITVSNPAFKGIHVPSLVQYLKDSGKLKPGSL